jgi:hypothetical protein
VTEAAFSSVAEAAFPLVAEAAFSSVAEAALPSVSEAAFSSIAEAAISVVGRGRSRIFVGCGSRIALHLGGHSCWCMGTYKVHTEIISTPIPKEQAHSHHTPAGIADMLYCTSHLECFFYGFAWLWLAIPRGSIRSGKQATRRRSTASQNSCWCSPIQ